MTGWLGWGCWKVFFSRENIAEMVCPFLPKKLTSWPTMIPHLHLIFWMEWFIFGVFPHWRIQTIPKRVFVCTDRNCCNVYRISKVDMFVNFHFSLFYRYWQLQPRIWLYWFNLRIHDPIKLAGLDWTAPWRIHIPSNERIRTGWCISIPITNAITLSLASTLVESTR